MTTYLALLRGINVGGHTRVGMDDLRRLFADLGHADVTTYIQSGNVIFRSPVDDSSRLAAEIEERIAQDLSVAVTVLLRTRDDLARIVASNPFVGRRIEPAKLHLTFLADAPDRDRAARLDRPADAPDELSLVGREVYLYCPNGYGRTKLNNAHVERRLGVAATTRNWNTFTRLLDLMAG